MKFKLLCVISLFVVFFSCKDSNQNKKEVVPAISPNETSTSEKATTNALSALDGIWVLSKLNKTAVTNKTSTKNPTLHINLSEGTIMGNGGCNGYEGNIHFMDENQVKVEVAKSTLIECENSDLEADYYQALSNGILTYMINDDKLTFYRKGTTLVFEKAK